MESDIDSLLTKVYDAQDQQLKEFKLLLEYTKLKEQLQIISANLTEQKNITSKMVTGIFQDQRNIVNQYANYNQHRIKAVSKDQVYDFILSEELIISICNFNILGTQLKLVIC